jgi:hypothetical protein
MDIRSIVTKLSKYSLSWPSSPSLLLVSQQRHYKLLYIKGGGSDGLVLTRKLILLILSVKTIKNEMIQVIISGTKSSNLKSK